MLTILAHPGQPIAPHDLWSAWDLDPLVAIPLLMAGWLYRRGRRTGAGTGRSEPMFYAGLGVIAIALMSPLDAASSALVSAHMVQHILLVLVAPPLIAAALPVETMNRGLSIALRKRIGRWRRVVGITPSRTRSLQRPVLLMLLLAGTLWFWHGSVPYQAAAQDDVIHAIEHLTFLVAALLFWSPVLAGGPTRRLSRGVAVLLVFGAAMQGVLLSALMTFSRSPWYPLYEASAAAWGIDALSDQRLAGLIMWIPSGLIYTGIALALTFRWVERPESTPLGQDGAASR